MHQGYCFLFSEANTPDAVGRLSALEASSNGFEIAEKDFELRGPGDVLGTRQHGELPLRSADLIRDRDLLEETGLRRCSSWKAAGSIRRNSRR